MSGVDSGSGGRGGEVAVVAASMVVVVVVSDELAVTHGDVAMSIVSTAPATVCRAKRTLTCKATIV